MSHVLPIALLFAASAAGTSANFQAVVDNLQTSQDIPGVSAVVIHKNDVVFSGASGFADIAAEQRMMPDTVLYVGSLSKIFTAILTLNLVEAGELSLTDTLDGVAVDSAGSGAAVSVAHVLTHSSGIPREGDFDYWFTADFPDSKELSAYLGQAKLRTPPGSDLHYSNVAYSSLGPVIEQASGQPYADALRVRVLQPLRMRLSGAPGPADNMANGYTYPGRLIPSEERPFAGVGELVGDRHSRMYHDARAMTPAFGIYSSAQDMGRLARFLLGYGGNDVLSEHMRARMRERQASGWGLGLKVQRYKGHEVARHDGWFAAHKAHILMDIRDGIAVVVMTNGDNASPKAIAEALFDTALEELR
jgi:CubicO group peptidase (beta-lactamase class C family)